MRLQFDHKVENKKGALMNLRLLLAKMGVISMQKSMDQLWTSYCKRH